jgi:hypothetical protein
MDYEPNRVWQRAHPRLVRRGVFGHWVVACYNWLVMLRVSRNGMTSRGWDADAFLLKHRRGYGTHRSVH